MAYERKADLDEIMSLTNPAVKRALLEKFADGADSAASAPQGCKPCLVRTTGLFFRSTPSRRRKSTLPDFAMANELCWFDFLMVARSKSQNSR
jgi:hypothetical protein